MVLAVVLLNTKPVVKDSLTKTVSNDSNADIEKPIIETFSLSNYTSNPNDYNGLTVVLKGHLSYQMIKTISKNINADGEHTIIEEYVYFLVDNDGNRVALESLSKDEKVLFVKDKTTKNIYVVKGVLRNKYYVETIRGATLEVEKISPIVYS